MIEQLVRLLNVLASWFERHRRNNREQQAQAERHDVEKNPIKWFDSKFGNNNIDNVRDLKNNASEIDQERGNLNGKKNRH